LIYGNFIIYRYGRESATNSSISFNSIQFIFYSPFSQITDLPQRALQSVHIDIPVPEPHIGSRKTPKQTFMGKKGNKPSGEQQRRIPLPGWTGAIDAMCTEGHKS